MKKKLNRHPVILFIAAMLVTGVLSYGSPNSADARQFPARPIVVINPYEPGGGTDIELRDLAPYLQKYLGQPIIIKTMPGAGTTLATSATARSKPDGYTLVVLTLPSTILAQELMNTNAGLENFEYIYAWFQGPNDITVKADSPYKTFADLLAASKQKPLKAAVAGIGQISHLNALLLEKHAGLKFTVVPYPGGGPAATALIRGDVDFYSGLSTTSVRFVRDGKLRQLAVLGPEPLEALPDTPTIYQLGYKNWTYIPFVRGVAAPPKTPADKIEILETAFRKAVADPGFIAIMKKQGRPITTMSSGEMKKAAQDSFKDAKEYMPLMKRSVQ